MKKLDLKVRNCILCKKDFITSYPTAIYCKECKEFRPCECGCGRIVKFPGCKIARGCHKRGKTYEEFFKKPRNEIKNGFQSGPTNPNYIESSILKRLTPAKLLYHNKVLYDGETFRSQMEVSFYKFLKKNNISFTREIPYKLFNGRYKIVDFIIEDYILVEVSGYVFEDWKREFDMKMDWVTQTYPDNPVLIVVDKTKYEECKLMNWRRNTKTSMLTDEVELLKDIKWMELQISMNKTIDKYNL